MDGIMKSHCKPGELVYIKIMDRAAEIFEEVEDFCQGLER